MANNMPPQGPIIHPGNTMPPQGPIIHPRQA